jgi:hypothetical protein
MTNEEQAKLDQSIASMGDMLPALWWRLFLECKERGFTEQQAMTLILEHIKATCK